MTLRERVIQFFSPKGGVWFLSPGLVGRGEEEVVRDLERYGARFADVIAGIEELSRAYGTADEDLFSSVLLQIDRGCDEAESIRWEIIRRISRQGLFFPESREDMLELINSMSMALSRMKEFQLLPLPRNTMEGADQYLITEMAKGCVNLSGLLSDTIRYLNEDPSTALEKVRQGSLFQQELFARVEEFRIGAKGAPAADGELQRTLFLQQVIAISQVIVNSLYRVQEIAIQYA